MKDISQQISSDGYRKVTLMGDDGKRKTFSVHRLVAFLYVKNPQSKPEVNHIDGNKDNNLYSILEWCTHSENIKHAWNLGLLENTDVRVAKIKKANIGRYGSLNPKSKKIRCIQTGEIFDSLEMAGRAYGICSQGIGKCYRDWETDRKSTRLNSSHSAKSRMPSSA